MPNITMDDFIDECLTGKKPKRKKKRIVEEPTNISSIFKEDGDEKSVINTKDAKEKTSKDDVEEQEPEEEKTLENEKVLSLILNINDDKKIKRYTKETFVDVPLNFQSILKQFDLNMDQIAKKAAEMPSVEGEAPLAANEAPTIPGEENNQKSKKPTYNKFRLSVKEFITSGAGSEKVELSWRREGEGTEAIETAEVITSNGSMPFNDSPDPLQAAITTFDRVYYDDIVTKIREEIDSEVGSE